jgi:hypothetical protein
MANRAPGIYDALRNFPRTIRLPSFRSVTAGSPSAIVMPLGVTYESINLRFTIAGVPATAAEIANQVTKVKATIDGDSKIDASATELLAILNFWNSRYGMTNVIEGVLRVGLSRPFDQEIDAQDGPAWGCAVGVPGGVNSFNLEVTLGAGATIDGIEGFAEVTRPTPLGRHLVIRRISDNQAAAGDRVMADWPRLDTDVAWYAIHIDKAGGTGNPIREVQLKIDQKDEIERCAYGHIRSTFQRYGLTQQTGFTHIPFARRGRPLEALPAVFQDGRLTLGTAAALGNFNLLIESLEGIDPAPGA